MYTGREWRCDEAEWQRGRRGLQFCFVEWKTGGVKPSAASFRPLVTRGCGTQVTHAMWEGSSIRKGGQKCWTVTLGAARGEMFL